MACLDSAIHRQERSVSARYRGMEYDPYERQAIVERERQPVYRKEVRYIGSCRSD